MSEAWRKLRKQNERENYAREREEQITNRSFLAFLPAFPALFILAYSNQAAVDVVAQIELLETLRERIGPLFVAYGVVIAYVVLIGLLQFGFHSRLAAPVRIAIIWAAWAWFYFCTWVLEDLKLAFVVLLITSLFMIRIVAFFSMCYRVIREGMFLGRRDDT